MGRRPDGPDTVPRVRGRPSSMEGSRLPGGPEPYGNPIGPTPIGPHLSVSSRVG